MLTALNKKHIPKPIIIISKPNIQSKILSNLIEKGLGVDCEIVDTCAIKKDRSDFGFMLLDCNYISPSQAKSLLRSFDASLKNISIALINTQHDEDYENLVFWPQVNGLFYEDCNQEMLLRGLNELIQSGQWLPRELSKKIIDEHRRSAKVINDLDILTSREKDVLIKISEGLSNPDIADKLNINQHTVKTHIYNIFKKIGVQNRTQAANWAIRYMKNE
ncbi:response regulator transcription factor [Marinobacterium lutimaris]|uniref:LuxR family transcriptional regulator, csgAB operon transcriptional regulatory protein n=1 Tax=Marinobacterium lutimaris TaxID=568106 RepID=A0A1H6AHM5_9GAMM|nr:response regulator transcription factor [Marinobacterium lutimaris]SEG47256.1 LuxR family transcriptional regulator, csgAB operon transcriptional regulatory protein [Marinobacterium lutimaris]